jgi:recombinational DNA repair protein (RecF pathway)
MHNRFMSSRISQMDAEKVMKSAGLIPLEAYRGLNLPWLCLCMTCKREVSPRLGSVKRGSAGCAYCAGRKVDPTEALEIMRKSGFEPQIPYPGNDNPWKSKCKTCHREVSPRFHHVKSRGDKCKYCSGKVVLVEDALSEMHRKSLEPMVAFPGASKPWKSICTKCGSQTSPRLADLRMGHSGCKRCADEKGGQKRRLLNSPTRGGKTTSYEEVLEVMRSAYLEPIEPYKTSQSKWKCKCLKCGLIVEPKYNAIKQGSGGCMACSRLEQIGRGKLDEKAAIAVMQGKNLEPLAPYPGAMVPWKSKCLDCSSVINPRYAHIQQGRKGCKNCGYKKNADGRRTSQEEAFGIARAAGFEPLEPYRGRHFAWKCRCMKCGANIAPHYSGIVNGGGCRYCSGLVVDSKEAEKVLKNNGIQPLVPYPGAGKPWLSECLKCKKEITPRYSSVNAGIGGCKYCASHGYDFSKGGVLYLITHENHAAHKIGITNVGAKEKRLEKHLKNGWQTYRTRFYEDGNRAFEVEQEILAWWRNELGLGPYLSASDMPQGGFTETIDANEVDLLTIWSEVEKVSKSKVENRSEKLVLKTTLPRKTKK